jgi:hypothetical protein
MTTTLAQPRLARTGSLGPLSKSIIPAELGKFYAYAPVFTDGEPLYALMDCKANKARILAHAGELAREVHLHFEFDGSVRARVSSIKTAQAAGLLGHVDAEFDDVWVARADIAIEDFYALCARRDSAALVEISKAACQKREVSADIAPGIIIAVMTSAGKYGLFLAKELTPTSISIDACHIWLP